jgi:DNA-binding SARP family transcriptional activator/tetratricopeptide (TPR) repeat protein
MNCKLAGGAICTMGQGLQLGLLGPLQVSRDGVDTPIPQAKLRVVAAAFLLRRGQAVSSDELAELLWPSGPPPSRRVTVRNYVKRFRQALGDGNHTLVTTRTDGYMLRVPEESLDALRFEGLAARAHEGLQAGHHTRAAADSRAALSLWRGRPLADVPCEQLVMQHAPRWEELRLQVLEDRIEADLRCGRRAELIGELRGQVTAEPLRERLHWLLMLALYREGRRADALAAFRAARRVLVDELGAEPGAALRRLHEQILAGDPAPAHGTPVRPAAAGTTVRPAAAPEAPRGLPGALTHLCGRDAELRRLDALAARASGPPATSVIAVIGGMGGVGKTALAAYWAHRVVDQFPDGQLFLNLRGFTPNGVPLSPAEGLGLLLEALRPAAPVPSGLEARLNLYRSLTTGKRLLIVLDNAREPDQVRPLLPGSPGSMAVITSRDWLAGLAVTEGAELIAVNPLDDAEAGALIGSRIGAARVAAEPGAVAEIVSRCGHLPLALAVVAAKAARPGVPLARLAAELRHPGERLDALDAGEPAASARAVLSWSYARLTAPEAGLFRLTGLHPGPDAGVNALASLAGAQARQVVALLGELERVHVVTQTADGRFALHDLLWSYARERAQAEETAEYHHAATGRLLDYCLQAAHLMSRRLYPPRPAISLTRPRPGTAAEDFSGYDEAWAWAEAEYPALPGLVTLAAQGGFPEHAWQLAWAWETFLSRRGRWDELGEIQRLGLEAARRCGSLSGQAHATCGLGWTFVLQGKHENGLEYLEEAARVFGQLGDQSGEARACVRAGNALWRGHRQADARRLAERALELFRVCGDRAGQAGALNNIGMHHIHLGAYQDGLDYCQRGLAIFRELGYRRGEANILDSLGEAYRHLGRTADAITCFEQSLNAFRELGDQYNQAEILTHLAAARQADGDRLAARQSLRDALSILTELNHPDAGRVSAQLQELSTGISADPTAIELLNQRDRSTSVSKRALSIAAAAFVVCGLGLAVADGVVAPTGLVVASKPVPPTHERPCNWWDEPHC